ncbi:hypothetical protein [uncultured Martelella sp.]|uniref:hypothetical protein n=1 Tax=uncultured Martelella sp. TaxID=392331 RepID=UPI0029C8ED78|nr:hypothetical protein [uncultured Martelella sp.]
MTIAPSADQLNITCDSCGAANLDRAILEPAPVRNDLFRLARQRVSANARACGWIIRRTAGSWQHYCPACARRRAGDITRQDRLL